MSGLKQGSRLVFQATGKDGRRFVVLMRGSALSYETLDAAYDSVLWVMVSGYRVGFEAVTGESIERLEPRRLASVDEVLLWRRERAKRPTQRDD